MSKKIVTARGIIEDFDRCVANRDDSKLREEWNNTKRALARALMTGEAPAIFSESGIQPTPVIVVSPEVARLDPGKMGNIAQFVYRKSGGGLGDIAVAQCRGLIERGIPTYFITLNLPNVFGNNLGVDEKEYIRTRHRLGEQFIKLVSHPIFESYNGPYDGDTRLTAFQFQIGAMDRIKTIMQDYGGRGIVILNDWMSEGLLSAYCRLREIPTLDVSHSTRTGLIPMQWIRDRRVLRSGMGELLSVSRDLDGNECLDCKPTGIKLASLAGYVGHMFLDEIVNNYFTDREFISPAVRDETKKRYRDRETVVLPNGVSPDLFPENQRINPDYDKPGLAAVLRPNRLIAKAEALNLDKFQYKTGLSKNPNAILLYWPSRFDSTQKGTELLTRDLITRLLDDNPDLQIAFVSDPSDPIGKEHAEFIKGIACNDEYRGRIVYVPFSDDLSMLGYAACHIVFGASLYEPFGLVDVLAWIYGKRSVNRNTGGYHDKMKRMIAELDLEPDSHIPGVLFNDYDSGGFNWALRTAIVEQRDFKNHPKKWRGHQYDLIVVSRRIFGLGEMMVCYMPVLEQLNGGKPLVDFTSILT